MQVNKSFVARLSHKKHLVDDIIELHCKITDKDTFFKLLNLPISTAGAFIHCLFPTEQSGEPLLNQNAVFLVGFKTRARTATISCNRPWQTQNVSHPCSVWFGPNNEVDASFYDSHMLTCWILVSHTVYFWSFYITYKNIHLLCSRAHHIIIIFIILFKEAQTGSNPSSQLGRWRPSNRCKCLHCATLNGHMEAISTRQAPSQMMLALFTGWWRRGLRGGQRWRRHRSSSGRAGEDQEGARWRARTQSKASFQTCCLKRN